MIPVMNMTLYCALRDKVADDGQVRVIRQGEDMEVARVPSTRDAGMDTRIIRWGEMYCVNCIFCADTRGRMGVSYRYGVDSPGDSRYAERSLWKCWNEECQSEWRNCKTLWDKLNTTGFRPRRDAAAAADTRSHRRPDPPREVAADTLPEVDLPGRWLALTDLAEDHHAVVYLRSRQFDPAALARDWGVAYAEYVSPRTRGAMAQDRILIPVRADGRQVGYQARYPSDAVDFKAQRIPKYLTYFPSGRVLYGADEAARIAGPVVVVEGVTDVWRVGPGAVARFGKRLSGEHLRILGRLADVGGADRPIVFLPDADDPQAQQTTARDVEDLARSGCRAMVAVGVLPPGSDPGRLPHDHLWRRIITPALGAVWRLTA